MEENVRKCEKELKEQRNICDVSPKMEIVCIIFHIKSNYS